MAVASVRVSSSLLARGPPRRVDLRSEPSALGCDGTILGSGRRCDSPGFVDHVRHGFHPPSAYLAEFLSRLGKEPGAKGPSNGFLFVPGFAWLVRDRGATRGFRRTAKPTSNRFLM